MTIPIENEDFLAHYGKKGMKWGERKAARLEKNASIDGARARQASRKAEVDSLTAKRINARTEKGKAFLDRKIADKKFEIDNNPDSASAKQLKTGEKVMKGVKIAAVIGMSVVGAGAAVSIVMSEVNSIENSKIRGEELTKQFKEQHELKEQAARSKVQ